MRPVVVDPRLIVEAAQHPLSPAARLLALLAYGAVAAAASGYAAAEATALEETADEANAPVDDEKQQELRTVADARTEKAIRCREAMEDALPPDPPDDLVLVSSLPVVEEAVDLAQEAQGAGHPHVHPDFVRRQAVRPALRILPSLDPPGGGPVTSRRDLVETALQAGAEWLVTHDAELLSLGPELRDDERGAAVQQMTVGRFVAEVGWPDFWTIDPPKVLRVFAGC